MDAEMTLAKLTEADLRGEEVGAGVGGLRVTMTTSDSASDSIETLWRTSAKAYGIRFRSRGPTF